MSKTISVKRHGDNYFYKASNVFPEHLLDDIVKESCNWIDNNRKPLNEEIYPPEASIECYKLLEDHPFWTSFYTELKKHILKYCSVTKKDISNLKVDQSWMTRVADNPIQTPGYSSVQTKSSEWAEHLKKEVYDNHTREEIKRRLSQNNTFGNMHSHETNDIGLIYYAKNPDPKYGTIVKLSDTKMFKNDGEENSLLIFNPRLYHTAVYPTFEDLALSPRISIVMDCSFTEESNQEHQTDH
jgi:hypothetical protein